MPSKVQEPCLKEIISSWAVVYRSVLVIGCVVRCQGWLRISSFSHSERKKKKTLKKTSVAHMKQVFAHFRAWLEQAWKCIIIHVTFVKKAEEETTVIALISITFYPTPLSSPNDHKSYFMVGLLCLVVRLLWKSFRELRVYALCCWRGREDESQDDLKWRVGGSCSASWGALHWPRVFRPSSLSLRSSLALWWRQRQSSFPAGCGWEDSGIHMVKVSSAVGKWLHHKFILCFPSYVVVCVIFSPFQILSSFMIS